jgi:hypothetical protein
LSPDNPGKSLGELASTLIAFCRITLQRTFDDQIESLGQFRPDTV